MVSLVNGSNGCGRETRTCGSVKADATRTLSHCPVPPTYLSRQMNPENSARYFYSSRAGIVEGASFDYVYLRAPRQITILAFKASETRCRDRNHDGVSADLSNSEVPLRGCLGRHNIKMQKPGAYAGLIPSISARF